MSPTRIAPPALETPTRPPRKGLPSYRSHEDVQIRARLPFLLPAIFFELDSEFPNF
jgi:hypothetical protein